MSVTAKLRFLRVSPYKVRKYAQLFKGKSIEEARAILAYHPSPTCGAMLKLLNSAVANAENNNELDPELMLVKNVLVDGGPTYRRWRARARGRGNRILKRSSHVTIELDLRDEFKVAARAAGEKQPAAASRKRRAAAPGGKPADGLPAAKAAGAARRGRGGKAAVEAKPVAEPRAKKRGARKPEAAAPGEPPQQAPRRRAARKPAPAAGAPAAPAVPLPAEPAPGEPPAALEENKE